MLFLGIINLTITFYDDKDSESLIELKLIEAKDMDSAIEKVMKFYDDKSDPYWEIYSIDYYDIDEVIK